MGLDSRFVLVNRVYMAVPEKYDHGCQLENFAKYRDKFSYWNTGVADENFANVSQKLTPGTRYAVEIYALTDRVPDNECLSFLKSQEAVLVGAQGLTLFWEIKKKDFPLGKFTVSLDEQKALWRDKSDQIYKAAGIARSSGDRWGLQVSFSGYKLQEGSCLLCFKLA